MTELTFVVPCQVVTAVFHLLALHTFSLAKILRRPSAEGPVASSCSFISYGSYLEVAVEQQQGSSQGGVALRHAVNLDVFREAGQVESLQADQLGVKHNLQADSQDRSELSVSSL